MMAAIGFFTTPVLPLALELGAEITYPLSEATPSGVLMSAGQLVGIIVILIMDDLIHLNKARWASAVLTLCLAIGLLFIIHFKEDLKRLAVLRQTPPPPMNP